MTTFDISSFFKEPVSSAGLFFPLNYIISVFPTPAQALDAQQALKRAGFSADEILVPAHPDVLAFLEDFRAQAGVTAGVMRGLSRMLGDDATFVDRDIEHARMGAGFLFVHCATEESKEQIRERARPFEPITMRWYQKGGIESLI